MEKSEKLKFVGVVTHGCRSDFKVEVTTAKEPLVIDARPKGKLRMNDITILVGDKVEVECDATDPKRGQIVSRFRKLG